MQQIVLRPQALNDLESIGQFIRVDNPSRTHSFVQEIRQFIDSLNDFPLGYPSIEALGNARMARYGKYQIYYRVTETHIFVVRILHGARDMKKIFTP